MMKQKHVPVPKDTQAFICANCGAVALDANNLCNVQGKGKKIDWCGSKAVKLPVYCRKKVNNDRWQCRNCGQTAVNIDLLCDPEKLDVSE